MVTSKSKRRSLSGRAYTRNVRSSVQMTLPSPATQLSRDLIKPESEPDSILRNLSCRIFPAFEPSDQKSTPLTAPCEYQSERWCGWSCSSPSESRTIGELRVIGKPPGARRG